MIVNFAQEPKKDRLSGGKTKADVLEYEDKKGKKALLS